MDKQKTAYKKGAYNIYRMIEQSIYLKNLTCKVDRIGQKQNLLFVAGIKNQKLNYLRNSKQIQNFKVSSMSISQSQRKPFSFMDLLAPFAIGGISGSLATCLIQPIDTFKVQIQVTSQKFGKATIRPSLLTISRQIQRESGLRILYTGLDSAIFRQLFYGSIRLGSYNWTVQYCKDNEIELNKMRKILLATISGAFGAIVGNPFDVALIRKQASINNKSQTRYKNTYDAFSRIIREEGLAGLWTGIKITILRVALINVGQLASKEIIADQLEAYTPGIPKAIKDNLVATLASVLTSFISLPADNIKVKLQKQHKNNQLYKGIWDCLMRTIQREGVNRLWVGFWIYLVRGFPHSFVLIRVQQFLTEEYQKGREEKY